MKNKFMYRDKEQSMKIDQYFSNPTGILALIRDGIANDWESLCRFFKLQPYPVDTLKGQLFYTLSSLSRVGLISIEGSHSVEYHLLEKDQLKKVSFKVTNLVHQLQNALQISLKEISKLDSILSLVVYPRFGKPNKIDIDVLVLTPFLDTFFQIYDDHIKNVSNKLGLSIKRADDFFSNESIIEDIWYAINSAKIIIADSTKKNPNVFYEIGIAHVIGKPVIFITGDKNDIPFDIGHIRHIEYEYTPRGMKKFEIKLENAIKNILDFNDIKINEYLATRK